MEKHTDTISSLARERYVENLIRHMKCSGGENPENLKDLAQDIYLIMMEKEDLIKGLIERNELNFYIIKLIQNNISSKSSPYYLTYKKDTTDEEYEPYE